MANRKNKKLYDDSWMYILLLTTLTILLYSLSTYKFTVSNLELSYSILGLPIVYFISNYITKKYSYAKTVTAISVSGVSMVLYVVIMNFALGKTTILSSISGHFCAYVVSQFVNLMTYYFLQQNTKSPLLLVFLNYIFSLIVFNMFYTLIHLNMMVQEGYWKGYFISLVIQSIVSISLALVDKTLVKRGRDE